MNKEPEKPQFVSDINVTHKQGECFYITTSQHRGNPCKKEEKLQSQEEWERDLETERLITGKNKNSISYVCPKHGSSIYMPLENTCEDCKLYVSGEDIRSHFIAKRDLRKLLEEVLAKFHGGGNGRRLLIELMAELKI